ncbi:MAG TPA: glycine--tRNA ligase subunit beta, partial [Thermoanaerobaculia bacterium]
MAEYFFELVTEEIPAWMVDTALGTIRERLNELATQLKASPDAPMHVVATSRRIAFNVGGLPLREDDREQELKGPPKKSAYDADGKPTHALQGFLKKQSASLEDVLESSDEYVRIRKTIAGRDTADVLRERIPGIIESLRWPKMMRWGKGEHSYIRPVHSIVSIFDEKPLPIAIFGTASGTTTVGHRTLAPKPFNVTSYSDYVSNLELAKVVVDAARRRSVMAGRAISLAKSVSGV